MAKKVHVVRVTPKAWQKRLNDTLGTRGKMNHAKWKKILTDYAKSRYGETDGLIGQTADSVLIAEWWVNEGIFNKWNEHLLVVAQKDLTQSQKNEEHRTLSILKPEKNILVNTQNVKYVK